MKTVHRKFDSALNSIHNRHLQAGHGRLLRVTILAICSALALPGIALAKKPVKSPPAECVMFPPTIYTDFPFTVKVVRDPAYPGVWSQPTVEVTAVFTKIDGSEITSTYSETIQRYGVTYINTSLTAPSCNGTPCEIDYSSGVDLTAVVQEPLNKKGNKFRETTCTLLNATVNMSN